jgi:hypothetical protein
MSDRQSLWPLSPDASIVGHDAVATPVRDEFDLAQLLIQMSEIAVVTQNLQQGELLVLRMQPLFVSIGLALL